MGGLQLSLVIFRLEIIVKCLQMWILPEGTVTVDFYVSKLGKSVVDHRCYYGVDCIFD